MPSPPHESVLAPDPAEREQLGALSTLIEHIAAQTGEARQDTAKLVAPDGTEEEIPASVFHALQAVVRDMAEGRRIVLLPEERDLTTQEAADMLNVSRQFLVRLLDRGDIPHHRVGSHRRLRVNDVLAYRDQRASRRRSKLEELTRIAQDAEAETRGV